MSQPSQLGSAPIGQLLRQQAVPASIGILVLSIYGIVDTIFVGQFVGAVAIGAITVVLPITYLISSIGMAIGVGGGSIISRAFGAKNPDRAYRTFGNQVTLVLIISVLAVVIFSIFEIEVLRLFGGKGETLPAAYEYFTILLPSIPFLAWAMMSNNVFRAEGKPKIAMTVMIIPAVINLVLDPIFIIWLEMGLTGAALATAISYVCSALFCLYNFVFGKSSMKFHLPDMRLHWPIVKEIFSLGSVTFSRQSVVALLMIVLNNTLFAYGGALALSVYGIIQRVMMFANFPVLGITQGFIPIAGFNFGAENWERVRKVISLALKSGTIIAVGIFLSILLFADPLVRLFTTDEELVGLTVPAIRIAFLATPCILFQLVGSAYFQAIGKALPALLLTMTKQGFCLIPLLFILPPVFGLDGVWMAFPIADVLSASICFYFLRRQMAALGKDGIKIQAETTLLTKPEEVISSKDLP
ncbi:MAG: MATE family efflux transporter [Bacteroidota bacterium]